MGNDKNIHMPWWILLLIGAIAAFLLLKFCQPKKVNESAKIAAMVNGQHIKDSIQYANAYQKLKDSSSAISNALSMATNRWQQSQENLTQLQTENRALIKKYKTNWASKFVDTSASLVPAAFINDCKDCFAAIEKITDSIDQYKYQADQLNILYISQAQVDSGIIANCDSQRLRLNKQYNDLRMAIELNAKQLEPRRKIKIGLAGRLNNIFLPNGVGLTLIYQDKKDRNFGFRPLYGNGQPEYVVDVAVPLFSF